VEHRQQRLHRRDHDGDGGGYSDPHRQRLFGSDVLTLAGGTFAPPAGPTLSLANHVILEGNVAFAHTSALTTTFTGPVNLIGASLLTATTPVVFSGAASGAGALTAAGAASVTLSGSNTYSGGTTVSSGTLQVGAGGATGSLGSGPVTDNANLVFDFSSDITLANAVGGSGTLTLTSTGGAVGQSAAITVPSLTVNALTGITLTNGGNAVSTFLAANGGSGALSLTTVASLSVAGITQAGSGAVTVQSTGSNTALTVNGFVTGGGGVITLQATGDLTVAAGQGVISRGGSVALGADLTAGGSGDDGRGTLTVAALAQVSGGAITLRGADVDIAGSALVSNTQGVVTTLAGSPGQVGSADGAGSAARFNTPTGVAVDSAGNVYVADYNNDTIRKVTPAGVVTTLAGSPLQQGSADGTGSAARFNTPTGVAVDSAGNVYVADTGNDTIRKVTPAGVVTTLAGSPGQFGSADGAGSAARFNNPFGAAVDSAGNVYVVDSFNNTIRKVTPAGVVTTLAGSPHTRDYADGAGSAARFNFPVGVAVDGAGNVYVAEDGNVTIRKVTPAGVVTTLAGTPLHTGSSDGAGSAASFFMPFGVAVDSAGNVFVADSNNQTIRKVTPLGLVTTVAGGPGQTGSADGAGSAARFNFPSGVAVDSAGNVYVADASNDTIRAVRLLPSAITVGSSVPTRPMSIGGSNNAAVNGINLTDAELARLLPGGGGSLTLGDANQTGAITLHTATPATNAGASTAVVQSTTGAGQIILDNGGGAGPALNGNGGSVSLTAGAGGIAEAAANAAGTADIGNAGAVTLTSAGPLGTASQPLQLSAVANLATNTAANNSNQFLAALTPTPASLNAGSGTITLEGGTVIAEAIAAGSTTLSAGMLRVGAANAITTGPGLGNVAFNPASGAATLDLNGFNLAVNGLSSSGAGSSVIDNTAPGAATLTVGSGNASASFSGLIQNSGGILALTKIGTGTQTLAGNNTYDGITTISAGTMVAANAGALGSILSGTSITSGGTLDVQTTLAPEDFLIAGAGVGGAGAMLTSSGSGAVAGAVVLRATASLGGTGNLTVSGPISGGFGLTKVGSGAATLAGSNTYTGPTIVNAGTLLIDGSLAAASSTTVNVNATLGGAGTLNGPVTVIGGAVSPGDPVSGKGILTVGAVDLSLGGQLTIQVSGASVNGTIPNPGSNYDRLAVTGATKLGGASVLNVDLAGLQTSGAVPGIVAGALPTGVFHTVNVSNNGNGFTVTPQYHSVDLAITAPATHFLVSAPAAADAGTPFSFTVTALDASNNTAPGYSGTVHFSSSDGAASLPDNRTLTNGAGTFSATFNTLGSQTLTATDTAASSLTGASSPVGVLDVAVTVTSFTPTPTGFTLTLSKAIDPSMLNLYDAASANYGAADVVLAGQLAANNPVKGSLLIDPTKKILTFVKTGGVLTPDSYTVTLVSAPMPSRTLPASPWTATPTAFPATTTRPRSPSLPRRRWS
jgi:autotransporter-associated beta strand protein